MKKITCLILLCLGALSLSACTGEDSVKVSELGDYTIVYPESYSEWKMTEVDLLKDVIKTVTGKEVNAVPDTAEASGKEIILGSSSRKTKYSETIDGFENAMCYVIGVDGNNIVLGGQNYYSDMRAVYDFVNNCLGYDDLADKYSEAKEKVSGENRVLWEKPSFMIMGSMFSSNPFQNVQQVKDFVDCNFNVAHIVTNASINSKGSYDNPASVRDQLKWCARFGIQAVILPKVKTSKTDPDYFEIQISDTDEGNQDVIDCPAVFGLYLIDEPSEEKIVFYQNVVADAKRKYSQLGWKLYVNTWTPWYLGIPDEDRNVFNDLIRQYLSECDAVSFDGYSHNYERRIVPVCDILQKVSDLARELKQDFYYFVESYAMNTISESLKELGAKYLYNYSKGFRTNSYFGLCFGAKMIEYFQYGDASAFYTAEGDWDHGSIINYDFSINREYYDCAKAVNEELYNITDILKDYDYVGAYTVNPKNEGTLELTKQYQSKSLFATVRGQNDSGILFGCYQNKETGKKALLVVNLDEFNNVPYDEDKDSKTLTLRFLPTESVKCYREGKPYEISQQDHNTYTVPFGNGSCYLFVMEEEK